ncbi:hypothetical protein [Halopiger aswanensis]|uniref:Uncharacterized protein n=1 Tax=Halopiger aswanensis TaxID=148449 RepID=A0A419WD82_9EURY|nr:hypothetical protein [Halopiger aswanensis]RKD93419.1 hypothetical protein ATJ93_3043 [Halopiger aswanensis]
MEFAVSRAGTAHVTLHGGADATACADARTEFATTLERLEADDAITDWEVTDAGVYEHPAAPFDPYTIALEFTVSVTVEADDADAATEIGAETIDEILERADLSAVSFATAPAASAA